MSSCIILKKKVTYSRTQETQFHLSFCWRPLEVARVCGLVKVLHKCAPQGPHKAGNGKPCTTAMVWGLWAGQGLSTYTPVSSLGSAGSGWRWIWSGRCSSPQTGGCSCPGCWTTLCSEAVKSSSIILAFRSQEATLSRPLRCYLPHLQPPPSPLIGHMKATFQE